MKFSDVFDQILQISINELTPSEAYLWLIILYRARLNRYEPVAISRDELAGLISSSTKTVQRAIKKLEQIGAIEVERRLKLPSRYKIISAAFKGDIKGDIQGDIAPDFRGTSLNPCPPSVPPSTSLVLANTNKTNNSVRQSFRKCEEPPALARTKKLSMWVLKGRKEACEAEQKQIRSRGSEFAMGFEYDSPEDKKRAKELKTKIRELNGKMQDADS